jgi:hypothetical protein
MINNFSKTLVRIPVTKTTDNFTGDETLVEGASVSISGAFYREEDVWSQQNPGLLQGANAVLLILPSVTINKDDKLSYDEESYRVDKVVTRRLGETEFYKVARLFKI